MKKWFIFCAVILVLISCNATKSENSKGTEESVHVKEVEKEVEKEIDLQSLPSAYVILEGLGMRDNPVEGADWNAFASLPIMQEVKVFPASKNMNGVPYEDITVPSKDPNAKKVVREYTMIYDITSGKKGYVRTPYLTVYNTFGVVLETKLLYSQPKLIDVTTSSVSALSIVAVETPIGKEDPAFAKIDATKNDTLLEHHYIRREFVSIEPADVMSVLLLNKAKTIKDTSASQNFERKAELIKSGLELQAPSPVVYDALMVEYLVLFPEQ